MNPTVFGQRLAKLRVDRNLTQQDVAEEMATFINNGKTISPLTISSYESGRKIPPLSNLIFYATYFGTSVDYLLGLVEGQKEIIEQFPMTQREIGNPLMEPDMQIRPQDWKKYQNLPVYVVFSNHQKQDGWGMLDYNMKRIVFTDAICPLSTELKLFRQQPIESQYASGSMKHPLNYAELQNTTTSVWIEMLTPDNFVKGRYNGWYKHNEDRTLLINEANNLMLKSEGCGIAFNAYKL